jgi:hypothetical protein
MLLPPKFAGRGSTFTPKAHGTAAQGTGKQAAAHDHVHPVRFALTIGGANAPVSNGDLTIEFTSNTSVTIKGRGSDGTTRSVVLTLA